MGTLGKAAVPGSRTASRDRNRDREPRIKARAGQAESGKRSERERHEGRGERSEGRGHAAPENDRLMAGFDGNPRSESAESDLSKPSRPQTSASPLVGIDATGSPRERPSGRSRFSVKTRQIRETSGAALPNAARKQGLGPSARPLRWAPSVQPPASPALSDGRPLPKPPAPPTRVARRPHPARAARVTRPPLAPPTPASSSQRPPEPQLRETGPAPPPAGARHRGKPNKRAGGPSARQAQGRAAREAASF